MEAYLSELLGSFPTILLVLVIAVTLYTLAKGADILVGEAVSLSIYWGIPKMIIGATIVSLGTTLPEVSVSVLAALKGNPDMALGNAIGSIIVDTGLILGLAAIIGKVPIDPLVISRQGKIQIAAVILMAVACLPFLSPTGAGTVTQYMGIFFLVLLVLYIFISIKWSKGAKTGELNELHEDQKPLILQLALLVVGITIVILSSNVLIPAVEITAVRIGVPQSIIAATLVAFGTSLPELVTAITAVRKGHGELAVGNIIGADILNVLFVTGSAAAVTKGGLNVAPEFYILQIPTMLLVVFLFRFLSTRKSGFISKKGGFILVAFYSVYLVLNFVI